MNYGGNYRNTLENLMFMSRAEDQDILNELVANKDNRILDWMYFEPGGAEHSISKNDPSTVGAGRGRIQTALLWSYVLSRLAGAPDFAIHDWI